MFEKTYKWYSIERQNWIYYFLLEKYTRCILVTMETGGNFYRCRYECIATETKTIELDVRSGISICELEN